MSKLTDFRVAVLATDGFEESELTEPVKALKAAGAQVTILSLQPGDLPAFNRAMLALFAHSLVPASK